MSTSNQNTTYVAESKDSEFDQGSASRNNMTDITNPFVVNAKRVKKSKVDKTSYIAKPMKKKSKRLPVISGSTTPKELVYSTPLATAIEKKQLADHKPEIKRMSTTRLISPAELAPQEVLDTAESTTVKRTNMRLTPLNSQLAGKAAESLVRKKKTSKWVEESQPVINRVQQPYIPLPAQQPSNWKSKFAMQKKNIEEKKALIEKEKVREASTRFHIMHSAIRTQDAEVTERLKNFKIEEPECDIETPNVPMMWQGTRNSILCPPPDLVGRHITKSHDENREISNQMNLQFSSPATVYKFLLGNHILEAFRNARMQTKLQQVNKARVDYNIFIVLDEGWLTVFKDYLPTAILAMTGAGYYYFTRGGYFPVHKNLPTIETVVAKCQENVGYQAAYRAFFFKDYASMKEISVTAEQVFKDLALFEDQKTKAFQRAKFFKKMHPHMGVVADAKAAAETVKDGIKLVNEVKSTMENVVDTLSYKGYEHHSIIELVMARLEDFVLTYIAITNTANFKGAAAVIALYVKSLGFNGSVSHGLVRALRSLFTVTESIDPEDLLPEDGEDEVISDKTETMFEKILRYAKLALSKWKDVKESKFITKMLGVVALVFALSIVPKSWLGEEDEKQGAIGYIVSLITKKMKDLASGTDSLVETLCEGVLFVIERVYCAIKEGDISLLFYDDNSLYEIDKEYALLTATKHMVFTESLKRHPCKPPFVDEKDYMMRVENCVEKLERLRKLEAYNIKRNKPMYDAFQLRLQNLRNIQAMISQQIKQACVKEKPFAVLIAGPSGIGKSYMMTYLYKTICDANKIKCDVDTVVTLNDCDQFDTEYKPHHNVVIMDDVANAKAETYKNTTPVEKIIKIINNVPNACLKASVEEKGQVYYNPKVVMVTTNKLNLMAEQFSNEPVSILRRFDAILEVKLKPECADKDTGLLDPNQISLTKMADAWDIKLSRVVPIRSESGPDKIEHKSLKNQEKMSYLDAVEVIKRRSVEHFIREKRIVDETKAMVNGERCEHSHAKELCPLCKRKAEREAKKLAKQNGELATKVLCETVTGDDEDPEDKAYFEDEESEEVPIFRYKVIDRDNGLVQIISQDDSTKTYRAFPAADKTNLTDEQKEALIASYFENHSASSNDEKRAYMRKGNDPELEPEVGIFSRFFSKPGDKTPVDDSDGKISLPNSLPQHFNLEDDQVVMKDGLWYFRHCTGELEPLVGKSSLDIEDKEPDWAKDENGEPVVKKSPNLFKKAGGALYNYIVGCVQMQGAHRALREKTMEDMAQTTGDRESLVKLHKSRITSNLLLVLAGAGLTFATYKTIVSMYRRYTDTTMLAILWNTVDPEFSTTDGEMPTPLTAIDGLFKLIPVVKHEPTECASTTNFDDLTALLDAHQGVLHITYIDDTKETRTGFCNAYPLRENFWLVPNHMFDDAVSLVSYTLRKGLGNQLTRTSTGPLSVDLIHPIPGCDAAIICLAAAGSVKPMIDYVAKQSPSFMRGVKYTKRRLASKALMKMTSIVSSQMLTNVSTTRQSYSGYLYSLNIESLPGDCMSPIILEGTSSVVAFHLSGRKTNKGDFIGGGGVINHGVLDEAIKTFSAFQKELSGIHAHSGASFPSDTYGRPDSVLGVLPQRHVLREIPIEKDVSIDYLGCHGRGSVSFRTQIRPYDNPGRIAQLFPGFPQKHHPPTGPFMRSEGIKTHDIWKKDLALIGSNDVHFDPSIMLLATLDMRYSYERAFQRISTSLIEQTAPYSIDATINGSDGVAGLSRLDLTTSAGWHWSKSKSHLVEVLEPTPQNAYRVRFVPEVMQEWDRLRDTLLQGKRINTIFRATIKDEPLKVGKGKMRIFAACDIAFSLLVRQYFCPIVRIYYEHWSDFEMAVGINAYGPEWDQMCDQLYNFNNSTFIAGDYSNYDKTMPGELIILAFDQMIRLAKMTGNYSEEHLTIMRGIACEIANPVYEYDGAFIRVGGSNPSGNPLTVIINCIANSILNRYVFASLYPGWDFQAHVTLFTYGDDDAKTVAANASDFTYASFQAVLATCNMVWTDNTKEPGAVKRHYDVMNIYYEDSFEEDDQTLPVGDRIGFLKRGFRYHEDLKRVVAPLERASMSKMLYVYRSKTASKNQQMVTHIQSLQTFLRECFLHGRPMYEGARLAIIQLTGERDYPVSLDDFPEYEVCLEKFDTYTHRNFNHAFLVIREDEKARVDHEISLLEPQDDYGNDHAEDVADLPCEYRKNLQQECAIQNFPEPRCSGEEIPYITDHHFGNYKKFKSCNTQNCRAENGEHSLLEPEAGGTEPTMNFSDLLSVTNDLSSNLDETASASADPLDLNRFMSRPIKIHEYTWAPGTPFAQGFNPWVDFFSNPRVINRINNFKLCRGNLTLKFVINGSKFHYGRMLAYYTPLHLSYVGTSIVPNLSMNIQNIMRATQQPCIYLDPSTNQGAELTLPFIYPKDAFDITTADWTAMGIMQMSDIGPLKVVGGLSSTAVSIAIYAWMENVTLNVPTSTASSALVPQSGDEYGEGVVSKPATVLSNLAGKLAKTPVIGPYARATQLAAGATAEIAKAFGYSRPVILDQPTNVVKLNVTGQLATTNTHDTSLKLTVDSKQELTIDPRTAGAPNTDDLSIVEWCKKECIVAMSEWGSNDAPGTKLMNVNVTPKIFYTRGLDAFNNVTYTTPSGYISSLFQFWRGEMCYRVSVVRSAFHVGRLRIVYDPVTTASSLVGTNLYDNVQYSWILDLQEANEAEMSCQWAAESNYLRLHRYVDAYDSTDEPIGLASYAPQFHNGQFAIYVETTLVTPNSVTDDPVYVFLYAHEENAEFAGPTDDMFKIYSHGLLAPESGDESDIVTEDAVAETHQVASHVNLRDNALTVHFGEKISSLRQLLKRYTLSSREFLDVTPSGNTISEVKMVRYNFPDYAGAFPWLSSYSPNAQTYAINTLLNILAPCFVGWRGSIRHKYISTNAAVTMSENCLIVTNVSDGPVESSAIPTFYGELPRFARTNRVAGFAGAALTQYGSNGALEFEVPFYSNARFAAGKCLDTFRGSPERLEQPLIMRYAPLWYRLDTRTTTTRPVTLDHYVSSGEDIAFFMFVNTPLLYKNVYI